MNREIRCCRQVRHNSVETFGSQEEQRSKGLMKGKPERKVGSNRAFLSLRIVSKAIISTSCYYHLFTNI